MKKLSKRIAGVILTLLLFCNTAMAAPDLTIDTNIDQQQQIKYLESMLNNENITDEAYELALEDYNFLLSNMISTRSITTTVQTPDLRSGVYHSNYSSTYDNHLASVKVTTLSTDFSGWDFIMETKSIWFGHPEIGGSIYEIKNTLGTTITGIAVSGDLGGIGFSGVTTAGASIVNTNYNSSSSRQTADVRLNSFGALLLYFQSSSTVKPYQNSSQDSTSAIIKAIVNG